ncbi:MAG TPA: transglutaminase domain-containing protein [Puia sp.]|nr:transglutaminase domain-containing protein [Puia sp.]
MKGGNIFKKYFFIQFFLCLVIVFFINLVLRKTAPASYARFLSYSQLYYDKDKVHIEAVHVTGDSLEIYFEGKILHPLSNRFKIFSAGNLIYEGQVMGKVLTFRPHQPGSFEVGVLINESSDTVDINIDYTPDSVYRRYGNTSKNTYEITSNALTGKVPLHQCNEWALDYWGNDTNNVSTESKRLLKDSIKILDNDNSQQKILKIAAFILTRTNKRKGIPADSISHLHPLRQLQSIENGKSEIWCGNFTSIFTFLVSSAGLPVRLVTCGEIGQRYSNGEHVFCEVYMKEDQTWAYVDLTSGNILVQYQKKWMNTIDIQRLIRYPLEDSALVAYHFQNDSIDKVPFSAVADFSKYYFYQGNMFTFYFGDFIRRMNPENIFKRAEKFFYLRPYYALYSDNINAAGYLFYLRIFTNYLFAAMIIFYLVAIVARVLIRKK